MWNPFYQPEEKPAQRQPQPTVFPDLPGAPITGLYRGARKGGDFYDAVAMNGSGRLLFVLMDIAGTREQAFNIAAHVQDTFRETAPRLFAPQDINEADLLTQLVLLLNRKILETAGVAHFAPAFIGSYSQQYGTLCYINAGHTPALLIDSDGCSELPACGLPLGLFSHATHDAQMAVLEPGAALLLVSRGVLELKHEAQEFGIAGVKDSVAATNYNDAAGLCDAVLARAQAFANNAEPENDITTLALVRAKASSSAVMS